MEKNYAVPSFLKNHSLPRWAVWVLRGLGIAILLVIIAYIGLAWYLNSNKEEVLTKVNTELNKSITGQLQIGDMETTFLKGFPRVSLSLKNTVLRDSLYPVHKHTLLTAGSLDVSVNIFALVRGVIQIKKIGISNAKIDLFTDANGYSNTSIFKSKKKKDKSDGGGSFPELKALELDNVELAIADVKNHKLYDFNVRTLHTKLNYVSGGFDADVRLNVLARSMAFNTLRGSFIKNKVVKGDLEVAFTKETGSMVVKKKPLNIGNEHFLIGAQFKLKSEDGDFTFNIENKKILWQHAAELLSNNITEKLEMFKITKPIAVKCDLIGGFNVKGDPLIRVNAWIDNNTLVVPGAQIDKCSFFGVFTNNNVKDKGYDDANSAIKLFNFKGNYAGIPVSMPSIAILNLEKPLAIGSFNSQFDIARLRQLVNKDVMQFNKGTAKVDVSFTADIVDYRLAKPKIKGMVDIKDADITYTQKKLNFRDVSVNLNFTQDALYLNKIVAKSGKSTLSMEGSIENFLNLYYTDPEKIVVKLDLYSPTLHMGEFMSFLSKRTASVKKAAPKKNSKGNFSEELSGLFNKSNVDIKIRVDKVYYNRFLATNAKANILLTQNGVTIKNAGFNHAGGTVRLNAGLSQDGALNRYALNADINNVAVNRFFYAMKNFGMESLTSENIKGYFTSKIDISGNITNQGAIMPRSINGRVSFSLQKGHLIDFGPVYSIGKFAFPLRNMKDIYFNNLKGVMDIKGEKIEIHPMQISSSVLNMDMQGIYSFGRGTAIYIDVPLRNPKKDKDITDKKELAERRNRGIVLHLTAADDEKDGKVKIKLGSKKG